MTPGMRAALRQLRFELKANRISAKAKPQFAALAGKHHLKLHLGAGDDMRPGWVNIDLALRFPPNVNATQFPGTVFINHDLRRGLPLADGSCDVIYSSHFFEHLSFADGLALMKEAHRVLGPGGVFRFALPELPRMFDAYLKGDAEFLGAVPLEELFPNAPSGTLTLVDFVNYGVYQYGEHVAVYDEGKAVAMMTAAGFRSARRTDYREDLDPSSDLRRRYSFYFEALK